MLNIYHGRPKTALPRPIKLMFLQSLPKLLGLTALQYNVKKPDDNKNTDKHNDENKSTTILVKDVVLNSENAPEQTRVSTVDLNKVKEEWLLLSEVLERICLLVWILVNCIAVGLVVYMDIDRETW